MAKAKGKRNHRKEKLEFVQDYLPIRDLKNGIIETTDNRYIKILEIEPINFTLRSDEEQFNIISSFASWLKISPMRLQFKSITRRADSDKHISMICEELEHEENPQCKEFVYYFWRRRLRMAIPSIRSAFHAPDWRCNLYYWTSRKYRSHLWRWF